MAESEIRNISFAGAGNVAMHLAPALKRSGYNIRHVISRTPEGASKLAAQVGAAASVDPGVVCDSTDLLIMAIPDHSIPEFTMRLKSLGRFQGVLAHTSGAVPLDVLTVHFQQAGVFYPLQSFSRFSVPEIRKVPVCVEANSSEVLMMLRKVALAISDDVRTIDSEQRALLHLSAVFACNFTNHMYAVAYRLLKQSGVEPDILLPLILETATRLESEDPALMQTGPAIRGDISTMEKHINLLSDQPSLQLIYKVLSESIRKFEKSNKSSEVL